MSAFSRTLALAAAVTLASAEIASCVAGRIMERRGLFYRPPEGASLAAYLAERDPDLGWPNPKTVGQAGTDPTGSRIVPAFPDPNVRPCASIYGDSFAWGEQSDDEHAWGNVLSRRADCRIANYGVGGFGTDQAFLRYARNKSDRSKVVILTHLSEDILRNVNRLRNLIAPTEDLGFKPRFVIGPSGDVELVPVYRPKDEADFRAALDHPEEHLQDEWFAPGGPAGVSTLRFPYLLSVVRSLAHFRIRAAVAGRPSHAEFYEADHPAHGLQVTTGIARAFVREATSRGASPLVVIIPLPPDFIYKRKWGKWPYGSLVDDLARNGVPFLETGDLFEADLKGGDPCSLYFGCTGHFNEQGNRLLAMHVHEWLTANGKL